MLASGWTERKGSGTKTDELWNSTNYRHSIRLDTVAFTRLPPLSNVLLAPSTSVMLGGALVVRTSSTIS
jgi:hypothetical protein